LFYFQAREIRSANTKISTLEKGLAQMASDFEQEKAALEQGLRAQLADAAAEQNALRRRVLGGRGAAVAVARSQRSWQML
jgi:hypothetical protein